MPSSQPAAGLPDHERKRRPAAHLPPGRRASGSGSARITKNATNETAGAG